MNDVFYIRKTGQLIFPADEISRKYLEELKNGNYKCRKFTRDRDLPKHKRWWAMVNFAYDHWDVDETDGIMKMCFDDFRKKIIILCGYSRQVWSLDGTFTVEAESISFKKMDDVKFDELYKKTVQVILTHVLRNYTEDDLNEVILQILRFD